MNELKSYTEYAVSTPTADFVIGFDFNYGEDAVNVTVDDVPATTAGYTVVYLNETTIRLSPSVPSGVVRLQRETDIDRTYHAYRAGAKFIAQTMDENFEQIRHSQQEVNDNFSSLEGRTSARLDTFTDLVDNLNTEFISTRDVVSDLVTISADTVTAANNALNTANAIDAKASTALSNSSTALSTATGIDAKVTDALDNSLAAVLKSSAALNTANAVDGKATQALADAATALTAASGTLKSSSNLSDVSSATISRNNLGVYSKSEVDTKVDFIHYLPLAYPKSTPPSGYLALMGQEISQTSYPILFALYGSTLPDLRAYTIRGLDNGRGIDVDRTVLSQQEDAIRNITGNLSTGAHNPGTSGVFDSQGISGTRPDGGSRAAIRINFDASRVVPTASENRVKNIAFLYIVKAG